MSSKYVLKRERDGKFKFTLQTHTREILLTSRCYHDKESALRGINMAHQFARRAENYDLLKTDIGLVYLVLKSARGEVIGKGRQFVDAEISRQEINLVKAKTRGARLEDLTDKM